MLLPWQKEQWEKLSARRRSGRLPHALLLTGPAGMGKVAFAEARMRSLLCGQVDATGLAFGLCRVFQLFSAGSHPDFRLVSPPEEGKVICFYHVRELNLYLA